MSAKKHSGFTLVEMAVVLAVIGLLVGGVLVGSSLLEEGRIRAQISQINKLQAAVTSFNNKYEGLPGDLLSTRAAALSFTTRSGNNGSGDNDGYIERCDPDNIARYSNGPFLGCENMLFWNDLTTAGLINEKFTLGADTDLVSVTAANMSQYFPVPVLMDSGSILLAGEDNAARNWFVLTSLSSISGAGGIVTNTTTSGMNATLANGIDSKIDDGVPTTGMVRMSTAALLPRGYFFAVPLQATTMCVYNGKYNIANNGQMFCQMIVQLY